MTYPEFLTEWRGDPDVIQCNTSGSTGTPKRILLPKAQVAKSALRTIKFFQLTSASHLYSCIAPDYIGGKMMAVRAELCGGRLGYETPSNRPLEGYVGEGIDLLSVVPSQMHFLLEHREELPPIKNILIGGSAIPPGLRKSIAASELSCWETYGMTETASHIALRKVSDSEEAFLPLEGIAVSIDPEGCLAIKIEGWQRLRTNDLAEITADGGFIIRGRKDSVIISGGKKVNPIEIEHILEKEFAAEFLVTSREDDKWVQKIVYMVEDQSGKLTAEEVEDYCRRALPPEARPKEIIIRPLPRTPNGKKDRKSRI